MDYRVQLKEVSIYRFYKIKNRQLWTDKRRDEFGPWLNKVIGKEGIAWEMRVSMRGAIFLYFLKEDKMCMFILKYGECIV